MKTIKISDLREKINKVLKKDFYTQEQKAALCQLLEVFLIESGEWKGFSYLGCINGGYELWVKAGKPDWPEKYLGLEFNRVYY